MRLPALKVSALPLHRFCSILTNLTGIRFEVDLAALARAGLSRETRLSVDVKDATVEDVLKKGIGELGLWGVATGELAGFFIRP